MNNTTIKETEKKYQKYSTPFGIIIIAIWGCILIGMMFQKINEFTNQYKDDGNNMYSNQNK